MRTSVFPAFLLSLLLSLPLLPADLYVAPNGSDKWSGRLAQPDARKQDGPLATLAAARDAARRLPAGEPKRILVKGGKYFLTETLVLDARDSGLTIEAAPGETSVLYGGIRITGWQRDGDRFWAAKLPVIDGKPREFRLLVVNDHLSRPARLPESGEFLHETEFPVRWLGTNKGGWERKPTAEELSTMKYRPGDLGAWLDARNAEVTVYHMWDESLVRLESLDAAARTVGFATPSGHPPGAFNVRKYVVWNVREGMSQPRQWYLDRTAGKVVYWPSPGEDMQTTEAVAPLLESVIQLDGTKEAPVTNVTLKGLVLTVTDTPAVPGGFGAGRYQGALAADFIDDCRFENLTIYNTGGQGMKATNTKALRVLRSEFRDTGASGIYLRGAAAEITDNHVYRVGNRYPSAIGIHCGGQDLNVSHNEVHDTPYTAINCGGSNHRIHSNLIYRAMTVLHDGAAIYFIFGKNISLRGNLVRDIPDTGGYGSSAYYIDEMSEGCIVEGNVSEGVARPSHNHWATKNTIRNNIFLFDGEMRLTFPRSTEFRFENNVLVSKTRIGMVNSEAAITSAGGNIFYTAGKPIEGAPQGTLIADPRIQEEGRVYRFAEGSPAAVAGIQTVDVSKAGRRK